MSLVLDNVSKVVGGQTHIAPMDLELESGSLSLLLGLTLSGKTSLMRLMAGLDKPTTGRILVEGKDVTGRAVRKRNVAMVYQQFINYPSLTVYENIASPLRIAGVSSAEIDRRVRTEAERLHIEAMLDRLPAELSGGQQQRTAMARALVRDAELVLLDEPLVNLDYKLRETLREELPRALEGRRSMVVYATTDPWEALAFGGRTAVLEEGRLRQYDYAARVYAAPATTHVASVFSDPPMNIVEGELTGDELRLADLLRGARPQALAGLDAGEYLFGLRPAHLTIDDESADLGLSATVDVTEISGSDTYVHCQVAGLPWVAVQPGVHEHELGAPVELGFDIERLFVFDRDGQLVHSPEAAGGERQREH
ncbi:ABC transporter ATP-binding protein [Salinisphaera sp.]|uniref:ABC transporter ATP-binding protein n=1 Tax=Salinisphaera sp. TaxID=1914330 RepID=UPI002D79E6B6|nr:ABC transporter ATP-binding protein [Salinisphaera sp.]HET7314846.1 ABC transporter ATP-binding protein [Salinisphaera sp.]